MADPSFSTIKLKPALADNLTTLGFSAMTPVQAESLPLILKGRDVISQARTGSGKTAAFGLGLLESLDVKRFRIQSLVLCPTRELAEQVAVEIRRLARGIHNIKVLTLCGGTPFGPQKLSLHHGAHVIVGTPGRVEEHLRKGNLKVADVATLVLDEADRMLDMGFNEVITGICLALPKKRQTLLFSATYPSDIKMLASKIMRNPARITIEEQHSPSSIRQELYRVPSRDERIDILIEVLLYKQPVSTLVFCNTKQLTEEVADALAERGFSATALHGDFEQKYRESRLLRFANGSISVLVATDVAARGLDIDALDLVVNFHLPKDPEVYTHRIGRTGRAGNIGMACSLYLDGEQQRVALLEGMAGHAFEYEKRPGILEGRRPVVPQMVTLQIDGGKRQKIRPGDLLGALTGDEGIAGAQVGKINILENSAFVAVERASAKQALRLLQSRPVKGRSFKARRLHK